MLCVGPPPELGLAPSDLVCVAVAVAAGVAAEFGLAPSDLVGEKLDAVAAGVALGVAAGLAAGVAAGVAFLAVPAA